MGFEIRSKNWFRRQGLPRTCLLLPLPGSASSFGIVPPECSAAEGQCSLHQEEQKAAAMECTKPWLEPKPRYICITSRASQHPQEELRCNSKTAMLHILALQAELVTSPLSCRLIPFLSANAAFSNSKICASLLGKSFCFFRSVYIACSSSLLLDF